MATIALPHVGWTGHLTRVCRIGEVLVRHGHQVIAWAPERFRDRIEATGATFLPHDPFPPGTRFWSSLVKAAALAEATVAFAPELIRRLDAVGADLVVHDANAAWGRVAGDFLGLPRIVSTALDPAAARRVWLGQPSRGRPGTPWSEPWERSITAIERCRHELARRWGVDIGDWRDVMTNPGDAAVVHSLEGVTGVPSEGRFDYIGPLLAPPERHLDGAASRRPLVLASSGTIFTFDSAAYETLLVALSGSVDAVVSLGGGPLRASDLTAPPNVTVEDYVEDQPGLLGEADAFITHAGAGSVHEALLGGTPMVCLPAAGDQPVWAARVAALGAGLVAEPRADSVRACLEEVVANPSYRMRAAELGRTIASYPGERRLLDVVDRVLASPAEPVGQSEAAGQADAAAP